MNPPPVTAEAPQNETRYPEGFPYKDREVAEARLGMELDKVRAYIRSDEGRGELIERLGLDGDAEKVLAGIDLNVEQLKKKESFFTKILKLPGRTLSAIGRLVKRHPILTTVAGLAALIALLYFMPTLAPTAGEYGKKLIQAFKSVISKVGIATPEVATDAVADLPITGGEVPMEVIEKAGEALQSPGQVDELQKVLQELTQ